MVGVHCNGLLNGGFSHASDGDMILASRNQGDVISQSSTRCNLPDILSWEAAMSSNDTSTEAVLMDSVEFPIGAPSYSCANNPSAFFLHGNLSTSSLLLVRKSQTAVVHTQCGSTFSNALYLGLSPYQLVVCAVPCPLTGRLFPLTTKYGTLIVPTFNLISTKYTNVWESIKHIN